MHKLILSCLLFCLSLSPIDAALETPKQFFVKQHWLSFTTTFDIETDQLKLGTVHRKFLSLSPVRYDFYDYANQLQAIATMRWLSWGATFDVNDASGGAIGRVEERLFAFFPTFEILSPAGHVLAIAKMNFWGTTYSIDDPVTKEQIATLSRSLFRLKDNWSVTLTNPDLYLQKKIDPRLFIIVMAFQTDREAWAAERNRIKEQIREQSFQLAVFDESPLSSKEQFETLKEDLKLFRASFCNVVPTEEEAFKADQWFTQKLLAVGADTQVANELERLVKAFAVIRPLLESDELTLGEKSALIKLFENSLWKVRRCGI